MKILSIRIKNFKQFKDTYIDLTDLGGNALEKICLIGSNGTGKTSILNIISDVIIRISSTKNLYAMPYDLCVAVKIQVENDIFYYCYKDTVDYYFKKEIDESNEGWFDNLANLGGLYDIAEHIDMQHVITGRGEQELIDRLRFNCNSNDIFVMSPSESIDNSYLNIVDVPASTVNNAMELFANFPFYHIVSNQNVTSFWTNLIFLIKKRDEQREKFERDEENINKTKRELIKEFDRISPKILDRLSEIWNKILGKANLTFDAKKANNPLQLSDNLYAYIYKNGTQTIINYSELSTGIRNFIFRIGHIYSLYFNREIKRGFVLIDEPENSLFPDFLYDLLSIYQEICTDKSGKFNTQLFMATHSPIVAAQFRPEERIILEWDEDANVVAVKGKAPEGDDPNDLLIQDFGLTHVMGRKGEEMWQEYLKLKKQLRHTTDERQKNELADRISTIGGQYNF